MPSIETVFVVTLAGLALSASPGPSMLYVLSRSIGQSRNAGFVSAVGLATGGMVLAVATALGLSALFATSSFAYAIVQYCGAAYLVYLGVNTLTSRESGKDPIDRVRNASSWKIFYQGVIVEVMNPKTILFFLAFIPQFVDAERGSLSLQMLVLGLIVPLTAVPSDLIVAITGGTLAQRISTHRTAHLALKWLSGLFLVGLGVRILFQ